MYLYVCVRIFACGYPIAPPPFKGRSFPIEWPWHLYWKSIDHKYVGLFLDSSVPLIYMSILGGRISTDL